MGSSILQLRLRLLLMVLVCAAASSAIGQRTLTSTATGTNAPGTTTDFRFTLTARATNFGLILPNAGSSYSFLYLKKGVQASETNWDFASALSAQTNSIFLEIPAQATNWFVRVFTPTNAPAHTFALTLVTNQTNLRTAWPVTKPLQFTVSGLVRGRTWNYYRVEAPTNTTLKISILGATNVAPDVYVRSGSLPMSGSFTKASFASKSDVIYLADAEYAAGAVFIGLYAETGFNPYTLKCEVVPVTQLNFDPGETHDGTEVFTNTYLRATNLYFKVRTVNPAVGAWRTVLTVNSGEANLYMTRGTIPYGTGIQQKSERVRSDGILLGPGQFNAGEDWYILVNVKTNAQMRLVSGAAYVMDLGPLASDATSSTNTLIGPEGWRFFKTTVTTEALAWALSLNGATNAIYLRKTSVPLLSSYEVKQDRQILVVPPYLTGGQTYFIGVPGTNGARISLSSRQQVVTDIDFVSTNAVVPLNGFATYRVQVPPSEIVWQVSVTPTSGNPNLYIRRNFVPNELYNEALSEAPGTVADSLTLSPPTLMDGTFFITVISTNSSSFKLETGRPTVTDIDYVDHVTNTETNRAGWRFFRVLSIDQQTNSLGWELTLSNAAPGTRIALRTNQVPSCWYFRSGNWGLNFLRSYDLISLGTFLQQPRHQANTWYVGVYNPSNALGKFTLTTRSLTATLLSGDSAKAARTNTAAGKWEFFRVDVPANVQGWDVRLSSVSGGAPRIAISREGLPMNSVWDGVVTMSIQTTLSSPGTATNWPGGQQWAPGRDWTQRSYDYRGTNVEGRVAAMGMGRPLEPGTYYVGVFNSGPTASTWTLWSRFIGTAIPVANLAYSGGTASGTVSPREAAYYHVTISSNTPTWKVKLLVTSGEAMLVVSTNRIPNIESEKRVEKYNREHFVLLPDKACTLVRPGDYYLAVIGEGTNPPSGRVNNGPAAYTLTSVGTMPMIALPQTNFSIAGALEGGESIMYALSMGPSLPVFETTLESRIGNPVQVGIWSSLLPSPGAGGRGGGADPYGNQGGEDQDLDNSPYRLYWSSPFAAPGRLAVKARSSAGGYPNASYLLRVNRLVPTPVAFDGAALVTNHLAQTWRFFQIDVPTNALGWDIRLTNVIGAPRLVVCYGYPAVEQDTEAWNPATTTNWPLYARWAASRDWTERSSSANGATNEDCRILAMGMNRPLLPGRYYASVWSSSGARYKVLSRGIGPGHAIPVTDLAFAGGSVTATNLPTREAAYFRITIPPNVPGWKLCLTRPTNSEAALVVLRDTLPNVLASGSYQVTNGASAGRKMQKPGDEQFMLLPQVGQTTLVPGSYYAAVIGEGCNVTNSSRIGTAKTSYTLTSLGAITITNLGTLVSNLTTTGTLVAEDCATYQFTVPPGTVSVEARLENRVGNPVMVIRPGPLMPDPGAGVASASADTYGSEGGENNRLDGGAALATIANPTNGTFYLFIKARQLNSVYTNASYTLRLTATGSTPLEFNGGMFAVTNQQSATWNYFRVDVPPDAMGWDLRLTNITGLPKIYVRRDCLPATSAASLSTLGTTWPSSNQWTATFDWTRRQYSASGTTDENGRVLAMGMGRPLQPGSYYVGVTGSGALSYTLMSRGIGDGFAIPITDLPFVGGSATNLALPPREAAYFRVVIPSNAPSSKMKLTGLSGEVMLSALRGTVPNVDCIQSGSSIAQGKGMQKPGNEHFLLLPPSPLTNLAFAGAEFSTNYFAVIAEGGNLTNSQRIGVGNSSFVVSSIGPAPVTDLGLVSSTDLIETNSLEAGESRIYQFTVTNDTDAVEIKLDSRVGNPVMVLRCTNALPDAGGGFNQVPTESYGNEGGWQVNDANATLLTIPNPVPGAYTVIVKARGINNVFSDASYRLRVRQLHIQPLNFGFDVNTNGFTNVVSGVLETNQRMFFRVDVPASFNDQPLLGWKLELAHAYGASQVRARKDFLPTDNPSTGTPFTGPGAYIVPPVLTNGTWYVEVRGSNSTSFTLTSAPIELERPAWMMPTVGETNPVPGLAWPCFGDTAVTTNATNDTGIYLEQGYQHYYAISIPTQNVGIVRVQLQAISGNPDVYFRTNSAPTITHSISGAQGSIYTRSLTDSGTEYANWVPIDGKLESSLRPGIWYVAVQAKTVNTRYRLQFSTGSIQDISINTTRPNQSMAGKDWIYYRFQMPDVVPLSWTVNFSQINGDVWLYIRDTVPPGNGTTATDFRSWTTDQKNHGPYADYNASGQYTFTTPPCRPGETYYLGFRALNDATFSVSIWTNSTASTTPVAVNFYGGRVTNTLAALQRQLYRIDAPADAARWKHWSTHPTNIIMYVEQGTIATTNNYHWRSTWANSAFNQYLLSGSWPWMPDKSYYLTVVNASGTAATYSFFVDGRSLVTDDEDADNLPDAWERQYFGNTGQTASGDPDGDGVPNYQEYVNGTDPTDPTSFPRPLAAQGPVGASIARPAVSNGSFQLTIHGAPNHSYLIEVSTDLIHWNELTSAMADTQGAVTIDDSTPIQEQRFYRLREQ